MTKDGKPLPNPEDAHFQDLSMVIPLGLIHLAQALHDKGLTVQVVHLPHKFHNLRRFGIDPDKVDHPVEAILKRYPARVCGIQAHFYLYCGGALHVSGSYKALFPDSTVVVGGYMATACWKSFLEAAPDIDGVVLDEGEKTLQTIIEKTREPGRHVLNTIDGVASRDHRGAFVYNPPRPDGLLKLDDRGREGLFPSPPSEPCVRFSRTRLSSRWFQHRDWLARPWASVMVKSPCSAKKAFGQRLWSPRQRPIPGRFCCLRNMARSRRRMKPSTTLKA
jgi:hypothetical protein